MPKEFTLFYMQGCPYCRQAEQAIAELTAETEAYRNVKITRIDENHPPKLTGIYDYYYVPSIFLDHEKLYEAHPGESYAECREHVRASFEKALEK